jgi:hypothetical protein
MNRVSPFRALSLEDGRVLVRGATAGLVDIPAFAALHWQQPRIRLAAGRERRQLLERLL